LIENNANIVSFSNDYAGMKMGVPPEPGPE